MTALLYALNYDSYNSQQTDRQMGFLGRRKVAELRYRRLHTLICRNPTGAWNGKQHQPTRTGNAPSCEGWSPSVQTDIAAGSSICQNWCRQPCISPRWAAEASIHYAWDGYCSRDQLGGLGRWGIFSIMLKCFSCIKTSRHIRATSGSWVSEKK